MLSSKWLLKISELISAGSSQDSFSSLPETTTSKHVRMVPITKGWAKNSINAVIFRRNSIVSHEDMQYAAFYGPRGHIVLAKRRIDNDDWEVIKTQYKGHVRDAHNAISIMVDGHGYLHLAWDQHNSPLRYCRGKKPKSLELADETAMTGIKERQVTYPEFFKLPGGNLLFIYRDGSSGNGDIMLNHYDIKVKKWTQVQDGFIDGQGRRNAYLQTAIDPQGAIHLSWVWRETPDVATNHDICYAKSLDHGKTWLRSDGSPYRLPITAASAEYACRVAPNSSLINQTSMATDPAGNPYIATYWTPEGSNVPQYFLVYHDGTGWRASQVSRRTTPFSLSGLGTKRIPVSRPLILLGNKGLKSQAYLVFRDVERRDRVSLAICRDLQRLEWRVEDLTLGPVDAWEPTCDSELWRQSQVLHLFVQKAGQGDRETLQRLGPRPVAVLEWKPHP